MSTTPIHTLPSDPNDLEAESGDPVLDELLDAELDFDPVARNGFISHLAMSLVAARRLGAGDDELRGWFDAQAGDGYLVRRDRPPWLAGDTAEVERLGVEQVVRRELPALVDAPLSQFFHGVIRLELAIDAGHPGQVANALGNLREHGHPLPDPPSGDGGESLAAVVAAVQSHPERRRGSMQEVREVTGQSWFADTLGRLRADDALLDDLAVLARTAHLSQDDFTTLHLVTGTRAVRALAGFLGPADRRRLALRAAQAAAVVAAVLLGDLGFADRDGDVRAGDADLTGWDDVARAARATGDAHVVKLAYAARLEEAATGERVYRLLAARQAGLSR